MNKLAGSKMSLLKRVGKKINTPGFKGFAAGAATGATVGGATGFKMPGMLNNFKKSSVTFTDSTKTRIRWKTFPGGPTLEGPTEVMKVIFRIGKQSKMEGIKMIVRLLKAGTIRKV